MFIKHEVASQFNYSLEDYLWKGVALNLLIKGGATSYCANKNGLAISDRFFLGGENFFGFSDRGVNNQIKGEENLGGDAYCQASLHLALPFPESYNFPKWFRPELFIQSGNLINSQKEYYSSLLNYKNLRSSVGLGFAMSTMWGRISINMAKPISFRKTDSISNYIQINFQLSLL